MKLILPCFLLFTLNFSSYANPSDLVIECRMDISLPKFTNFSKWLSLQIWKVTKNDYELKMTEEMLLCFGENSTEHPVESITLKKGKKKLFGKSHRGLIYVKQIHDSEDYDLDFVIDTNIVVEENGTNYHPAKIKINLDSGLTKVGVHRYEDNKAKCKIIH